MTRMRWYQSMPAAALVILAFAVAVSANHSWGNYHWKRTENQVALAVGDNVSAVWDGHLVAAIADWNNSSVLSLTKVAGGTKPKSCRPTSGRIEVCNAKYGNNGWLGLAQIWVSGGHITQAVTKVNDTYFNTPTYNDPGWRQLVVCQEIGHDFGLAHQDENFNNKNLGSCMDYTSNPYGPPDNLSPNSHDYAQLESIYDHFESAAGTPTGPGRSGSAPPAMGQIDFETPNQWGQLVRSLGNGRVQEYELDFGGGHKVVTRVFWADPEADARGRR